MSGSTSHTIRKQFLHIDLEGTESEGLVLQRDLADLCNHQILPAIEEALNRCAPSDGYLCLDRLEIHAGTLTIDRLEKDLFESIANEIGRVLRDQFPASAGVSQKQSMIPQSEGLSSTPPGLQWKNAPQRSFEAFLHFLDSGRFPWSYRLPTGESLEQTVRKLLLYDPPLDLFDSDLRTILMSPDARKRLASQFSSEFVADVVSQIAPGYPGIVRRVQSSVFPTESGSELPAFIDRLWEVALKHLSTGTKLPSEGTLADMMLHGQMPFSPVVEAKLKRLSQTDSPDAAANLANMPADQEDAYARSRTKSHGISDDEAIYLDNAGLVLLHPFLPLFFEAVGVAREGRLVEHERALGLLHFLATGQETAPEHELVLPKLLCGLDPQKPVGRSGVLSENEKNEATALLEAVIRHWEALRNTTPEGLRSTFLLRAGKLAVRNDGEWLLQVELKSFDVLLDQMPWGFALVQLPWMTGMLRVEWGDTRS